MIDYENLVIAQLEQVFSRDHLKEKLFENKEWKIFKVAGNTTGWVVGYC